MNEIEQDISNYKFYIRIFFLNAILKTFFILDFTHVFLHEFMSDVRFCSDFERTINSVFFHSS